MVRLLDKSAAAQYLPPTISYMVKQGHKNIYTCHGQKMKGYLKQQKEKI